MQSTALAAGWHSWAQLDTPSQSMTADEYNVANCTIRSVFLCLLVVACLSPRLLRFAFLLVSCFLPSSFLIVHTSQRAHFYSFCKIFTVNYMYIPGPNTWLSSCQWYILYHLKDKTTTVKALRTPGQHCQKVEYLWIIFLWRPWSSLWMWTKEGL